MYPTHWNLQNEYTDLAHETSSVISAILTINHSNTHTYTPWWMGNRGWKFMHTFKRSLNCKYEMPASCTMFLPIKMRKNASVDGSLPGKPFYLNKKIDSCKLTYLTGKGQKTWRCKCKQFSTRWRSFDFVQIVEQLANLAYSWTIYNDVSEVMKADLDNMEKNAKYCNSGANCTVMV